jgi:REP element-mobilizing transposase RayT
MATIRLWSVANGIDIRREKLCIFLMQVHLLLVTRYRRKIFFRVPLRSYTTISPIRCSRLKDEVRNAGSILIRCHATQAE